MNAYQGYKHSQKVAVHKSQKKPYENKDVTISFEEYITKKLVKPYNVYLNEGEYTFNEFDERHLFKVLWQKGIIKMTEKELKSISQEIEKNTKFKKHTDEDHKKFIIRKKCRSRAFRKWIDGLVDNLESIAPLILKNEKENSNTKS